MPVPVQVFLLWFTFVVIALPVVALRSYRLDKLDDSTLALSWVPPATWIVTPVIVYLSGQVPPSQSTSAALAVILLGGMAAAVAVAIARGAPRATRGVAWASAVGLLLRAGFAAIAAARLLQA